MDMNRTADRIALVTWVLIALGYPGSYEELAASTAELSDDEFEALAASGHVL